MYKKIYIIIIYMLAMVLALFYSVFALDSFAESYVWYEQLLMFSLHLLPSYLIVLSMMLRRKYPLTGSSGFIFAGVFFTFFYNTYRSLDIFLLISVPPIVIGILFLIPLLIDKKASKKNELK